MSAATLDRPREKPRVITVRLSDDDHAMLKEVANWGRRSMNDLCAETLRDRCRLGRVVEEIDTLPTVPRHGLFTRLVLLDSDGEETLHESAVEYAEDFDYPRVLCWDDRLFSLSGFICEFRIARYLEVIPVLLEDTPSK